MRPALLGCVVFFSMSCAHRHPAALPRQPAPFLITKQSTFLPSAKKLHRFLEGTLSETDFEGDRKDCQIGQTPANPFCFMLPHLSKLQKRVRALRTIPVYSVPKIPEVPEIKLVKGKIDQWETIRSLHPRLVVKGLVSMPVVELKKMMPFAKKSGCPNSLAAALAAVLEDFSDDVKTTEVSSLYAKAAACSADPIEEDHFLVRAGMLHVLRRQYLPAIPYFLKASQSKGVSSRALYWLSKCNEMTGQKGKAEAALMKLFNRFPLALHTIVLKWNRGLNPAEVIRDEVPGDFMMRSKRVSSTDSVMEAIEILSTHEFEESAALVAEWAIEQFPALELPVKLYLATFAFPRARIAVSSEPIMDRSAPFSRAHLQLLFPLAFETWILAHKQSVDPYLLLSIARQESTLNERALSPANARGLLQIHPLTSQKYGKSSEALFDPEINIEVAARYLTDLMKRYGKLHFVLGAYNAGEDKLEGWIKRYPTDDTILFMDSIPYRETRNYVASVMRSYFWYRQLYGEPLGALF